MVKRIWRQVVPERGEVVTLKNAAVTRLTKVPDLKSLASPKKHQEVNMRPDSVSQMNEKFDCSAGSL